MVRAFDDVRDVRNDRREVRTAAATELMEVRLDGRMTVATVVISLPRRIGVPDPPLGLP